MWSGGCVYCKTDLICYDSVGNLKLYQKIVIPPVVLIENSWNFFSMVESEYVGEYLASCVERKPGDKGQS